MLRRLFGSVIFLFSVVGATVVWAAQADLTPSNQKPFVELAKYSFGNYPILQTATSETEAQFNALVPRLKNYEMRAIPLLADGKEGEPIVAKVVSDSVQDPQRLLHDKAMRFQIQGLNPKIQYRLELHEVSKYNTRIVEQRLFRTMILAERALRFATISCMSDEKEFAEPRDILWKKVAKAALDVVFLLGDMTYVDSFNSVARDKVTPFDIWMRTFDSFKALPLAYHQNLTPVQFTWDDHDAGVDNANKDFPHIKEAAKAIHAVYGGESIEGVVEYSQEGLYKYAKLAGHHFFLFDNRSFRTSENVLDGEFGSKQKAWFFDHLGRIGDSGPVYMMSGTMWGSPTIMKSLANGQQKRMTESMYGDHPLDYKDMFGRLNYEYTNVTYMLFSGDIHFSQVVEHGRQERNSGRLAPFTTWDVTSSPIHSFLFAPKKGEAEFWADPQRLVGRRDYNFVVVDTNWQAQQKALQVRVQSIGMQEEPLFSLATTIARVPSFVSQRRRILAKGFERMGPERKVKVAFFDSDATLRVAPSGEVSAQSENDVFILPNVAEKIADLNRQGYLIAIVSNQGGVSRGKISIEQAEKALLKTISLIREQNPQAKIHYLDYAEQNDDDFNRKPNIGMGKNLERVLARQGYRLDWANSFMIGDAQYKKTDIDPRTKEPGLDFTNTDRLFAENLGIKTAHASEFFGWTAEQLAAVRKNDVVFLSGGKIGGGVTIMARTSSARQCAEVF